MVYVYSTEGVFMFDDFETWLDIFSEYPEEFWLSLEEEDGE